MKITARTLAIEYSRRAKIRSRRLMSDDEKFELELAFFAGYKMAEKVWRKKLKEVRRD